MRLSMKKIVLRFRVWSSVCSWDSLGDMLYMLDSLENDVHSHQGDPLRVDNSWNFYWNFIVRGFQL